MASGLFITSDTLTPGLKRFPDELDRRLAAAVEYWTPVTEGYARMNAPWTDRTGNARNGLRAEPFHDQGRAHGVQLSHSVPYGIWLEVRHEGRFAIIVPTIKVQGRALMQFIRSRLLRSR